MVIIGLALGIFIHETGIVQKVKEKIFSKKE
jgi:hypothetical protein